MTPLERLGLGLLHKIDPPERGHTIALTALRSG